ncbi:hypothetical protein PFISCL1PPCAC_28588, partial [Pristionchus fissidentatus]
YRLVQKGDKHENRYIRHLDRAPNLLDSQGSNLQRVTKSITSFFRGENRRSSAPRWGETYKNILRIKNDLESQERQPSARVYDSPVHELVFNKTLRRSRVKLNKIGGSKLPPLVNAAFSLVDSLRLHTSKTREDPNYKMLSPRF